MLAAGPAPAAWAADAAPERLSLQAIEVSADKVTLKLTGPAKYNTFVTASPPRLVLELLNTETALAVKVIEGKGKVLKRVRAGQFSPEIARIVLDLSRAVTYRVGAFGNDLVVALEADASAEGEAPPKTEGKVPEVKAPEPKVEAKLPVAAAVPEAKVEPKVEPKPEAKPEAKPAAKAPAAQAPAKTEPAALRADREVEPKPEAKPAVAEAKPAAKPVAQLAVAKSEPRETKAPAVTESKAEDNRPFSTDASNEVVEMGTARRGDVLRTPVAARASSLAPVRPFDAGGRRRRDIMATLPKDLIPSLDVDDVDVRDVLKMLASKANINLIYGPEVSGTMSVHLERVPFSEAFNIVLAMNKLVANQVGENILQITTPTALKEARSKQLGITRVFPVYYGKADELKTTLDSVRAAEGRQGVSVLDVKNNSIIVTESPEGLAATERLLSELDTRPRQVLIEAKLVEVKLTKDFQMGIQWDYFEVDRGRALGKDGLSSVGAVPGVPQSFGLPLHNNQITMNGVQTSGNLGAAGRGTGVLLPADKVFGALTLGRITNNYLLSATLTAAAAQGKVKVLSDPKIATINGKEAKINITNQTPYVTSSVTPTGVVTTAVQYVTTGIQLAVKPTINADGRITLDVKPKVSQPSATAATSGASAAPGIESRDAETNVVVRDGETIVIGGLITDSVSNTEAKIPLLGDIPILGWLFRKKTVIRSRVELLIFVTTKIMPD